MKTTVEMKGLRELGLAIKELDSRLQKKIMRNSLAAGARIIQKSAREKAPVLKEATPGRKPGTVKRAIKYKVDRAQGGKQEARVWVKGIGSKAVSAFKKGTGRKSSENPNDPYYWWMVEFGTARSAAQPFMRPAFEDSKMAAAEKMKQNIADRIEKEGAQIGRSIGKAR